MTENEKTLEKLKKSSKGRLVVGLFLILIGAVLVFIVPSFVFNYVVGSFIIIIFLLGTREFKGIWKRSEVSRLRKSFLVTAGYIYFVVAIIAFTLLTTGDNGQGWFLLIVAAAGIYDGVAFYVGQLVGKHRITKQISKGKTAEGTVAGYFASFFLTLTIVLVKFHYLELWQVIGISLTLPFLAFAGDLLESCFKRGWKIKDSGAVLKSHGGILNRILNRIDILLKGHGGIWDRIDSHLLVACGVYLLKIFWFL